jgi:hypothetical protein
MEDTIPAASIPHADVTRTTIDVAKTARIDLWDRLIVRHKISKGRFYQDGKKYGAYHPVPTDGWRTRDPGSSRHDTGYAIQGGVRS